jgi:hypothetical protein
VVVVVAAAALAVMDSFALAMTLMSRPHRDYNCIISSNSNCSCTSASNRRNSRVIKSRYYHHRYRLRNKSHRLSSNNDTRHHWLRGRLPLRAHRHSPIYHRVQRH